jgi:hypothetical protein
VPDHSTFSVNRHVALVVVVLVQGKWTSQDSWFVAVYALAVMAMMIGHYVNQTN